MAWHHGTHACVRASACTHRTCADRWLALAHELVLQKPKACGAAELDFDEFCEIVVRICNEKVPEPRDAPFELTLESWLGLFFLPRIKQALKNNFGKVLILEKNE